MNRFAQRYHVLYRIVIPVLGIIFALLFVFIYLNTNKTDSILLETQKIEIEKKQFELFVA